MPEMCFLDGKKPWIAKGYRLVEHIGEQSCRNEDNGQERIEFLPPTDANY